LWSSVEKGSVFRNGKVTLTLKGLSLAGGRPCALGGYDSGASTFSMTLLPMPGMPMRVEGGSHYMGDLYVDLETQWLLEASMAEMVVSKTSGNVLPQPLSSVIERRLELRSLAKPQFDTSLATPGSPGR
jgi:hypothetical protein